MLSGCSSVICVLIVPEDVDIAAADYFLVLASRGRFSTVQVWEDSFADKQAVLRIAW